MMMAGLQTVPEQLLRAARVDGASAWQRFWHVTFPHLTRRQHGHGAAARGGQLQLLHHSLDHDRRRAGERLAHLDHPRSTSSPSAGMRFGAGLGLFGDPVPHPDDARLLLRPRADRAATTRSTRDDARGDAPIALARGGRLAVFLAVLLLFAVLPMVWMLLTSIKSQFAAVQFPPRVVAARADARRTTRACSSPNSDSARTSCAIFWNSLWVSTATTILGVIVAVPAAYAFSRFRFPGRNFLFFCGAAAQHVPGGDLPHAAVHPDALAAAW